jgi:hypothetical protein
MSTKCTWLRAKIKLELARQMDLNVCQVRIVRQKVLRNSMHEDDGTQQHKLRFGMQRAPFGASRARGRIGGFFLKKKNYLWKHEPARLCDLNPIPSQSPKIITSVDNSEMHGQRSEWILLVLGMLLCDVSGSNGNMSEICCSTSGLVEFYAADEACSIFGWTLVNCTSSETCRQASCRSSAAARYLGGCYNDSQWADQLSAVGDAYICTSSSKKTHSFVQGVLILTSISIAIIMR